MNGKTVLITGGTGAFGKAFARRAMDYAAAIRIYSRDEWKQAQMRTEFKDDELFRWLIGDVRDRDRLERAMEGVDIVIHAAALKRVEVGEYNPDELVKTNVIGALNVIEAAKRAGVKHVVALSTDKACAPLNAYGATKLTAEKMFLAANNAAGPDGPTFAVTRYGNVAGSTGSVIPIWRDHLKTVWGVPVTDPDATRFWMSMDEAVDLVLWAIGKTCLVVPDLPAYAIRDLAHAMGAHIMDINGMRPGEKLHETMISEHECHEFYRVGKYCVRDPVASSEALPGPLTSDRAERLSVENLRERLRHV